MNIILNKENRSYLIIVIVLLIIFVIFFYYQNKETVNGFFSKEDDNMVYEIIKKDNNEDDSYIDKVNDIVYNPNGPILTKENLTQYDFKKLLKNLDKINKRDLIVLKGETNYQFYTQSTTRDRLRMDLDQITKQILPILNSKTYDFASTNYGDVKVWTDKDNNEEIKYELFLWDKKNYFEIKLWVHVIKFVSKDNASKYGVRKSPYLFPTYFIGYPAFDQMIPPPDQVITTANLSNYPEGICTNDPLPIQFLYINRVEIQNSTLVVNYNKNKYPYPMIKVTENGELSGINDMTQDYMKVIGDDNPIFDKAREYNKWPKLDEEPSWEGQYPCKEPPINKWNDEGIYYYEEGQGALPKGVCKSFCPGTRWSSMQEPLQPNFWIANFQSQPCGENYWLFDLARGLPGVFFGGGKR